MAMRIKIPVGLSLYLVASLTSTFAVIGYPACGVSLHQLNLVLQQLVVAAPGPSHLSFDHHPRRMLPCNHRIGGLRARPCYRLV